MKTLINYVRGPTIAALAVFAAGIIVLAPSSARAEDGQTACEAGGGLFGSHCCNCSSRSGGGYACQSINSSARWSCTSEFCSETSCII